MLESLKKSPLKTGIILAVLILLNVVGWFLYFNWDKPFGAPLDLPTATQEQLPTATSTEPPVADAFTETPEPDITPTISPVCGDDTSMTILVTGIDSEGYLFGLADSIRLVRIDFQAKRVDVVAMPRDLWVDIPGIATSGVSHGK
ncbi:MAG: hypothetical protein MUP11_09165, partial [Anaerolineales bacterium]|nr:hypothetical protein [Anaerolineales bacterium]